MMNLWEFVAELRRSYLERLQTQGTWGRTEAYMEFEQALSEVLCGTAAEGFTCKGCEGTPHGAPRMSCPFHGGGRVLGARTFTHKSVQWEPLDLKRP